ncbi:MAG: 50S ribosomal protein L23 [Candidatus Euphemobacter frigidus]|nr:50S ribosomal protein L23 [Candidatus Euphemobacter frigidus]MDP8276202.1 50S ribosomal protein L23 [Candidatus Euphemobacter frigidus]
MKEIEARQLILNPVITEKGTGLQEKNNQYLFRVDPRANKIQIKEAIQKVFNVDVTSVRTITVHGKLRMVGRTQGRKPSWKKAIVTLKEGDTIDLT